MKNKKHARRVKRLALICTMCTIILVVSTYAWFIGMKTVNVSTFDVEIAATEGLSLSLNGKYWAESVNISSTNYINTTKAALADANSIYDGSTNTWGGSGLVPISTVGQINTTSSRLMMYEKGSLTATPGGYRLMASKVENDTVTKNTEEGSGYVAFDLFVRNLSGSEYYTDFNYLNEEAIYLTQDSKVSVVSNGSDEQELTGIENSVRVAFAQIGRVEASNAATIGDTEKVKNATADKTLIQAIQDITCTTDGGYDATSGVTGICTRYAQIWEPNDQKHVVNALNWYDTACKTRSGEDVTLTGSYSGACTAIGEKDGEGNYTKTDDYVQTYAVGSVIDYSNNIDVYDGTDYNTYTTSISTQGIDATTYTTTADAKIEAAGKEYDAATSNAGKLYKYNYFTDTEKMLTGMDRPTFITLAPNSITKIRVYVYLEGQDIDNYDFASLGKKISVSFGFTKERFFDTDIDYEGPAGVPTTSESAS